MFVFPISKQKKLRKLPWVTISLIIINFLVFFETWNVSVKNYEELIIIEKKTKTIKENIEKFKSEINNLIKSKENINKQESNSNDDFYVYNYYRQQDWEQLRQERIEKTDTEILEKQEMLLESENEAKKNESGIEILKSEIPFYKYGYFNLKSRIWTLITYQFLHGGYLHLVLNMFFLWFVGANIEDRWGRWFFLGFYIVSGMVAALFHTKMISVLTSNLPLIGASGGIAGLMGSFMIRYPATKIKVFYAFMFFKIGFAEWPAWFFFIFWFITQFLQAVLSNYILMGNVAYWTHVGGFLFGVIIAIIMKQLNIEEKFLKPAVEKEEKKILNINPGVLDAREKIEEGDEISAEKILRETIKTEPYCLEAYITLFDIQKKYYSKFNDEMIKIIFKIIEISAMKNDELVAMTYYYTYRDITKVRNALSLRTCLYLGRILESKDDWPEAITIYNRIIEDYSDDFLSNKAYFALGKILIKQKQKERAIKTFNNLLKRPEGYNYKEMVQIELKKAYGDMEVL